MVALGRRKAVALVAAAVAATPRQSHAEETLILNDASQLDPTRVARHIVLGSQSEQDIMDRIRNELKQAADAGRPVATGIARHSMGGQSLAQDGTAFTFQTSRCVVEREMMMYRAQAGTHWRDVIATLDPQGFSPAVMQSNNDFGVASTFSVNAHGWPVPYGPFGTTVRSLRMMLADGSVVTCSRDTNAELFCGEPRP
jgi:FAD/FMN-containing dehydrogenase